MDVFRVKQFLPHDSVIRISVPASKSLLNRALVLSAFMNGEVELICGTFAEDTRVLIECLHSLGIQVTVKENSIIVCGCGGKVPRQNAEIYVGSAGTAARFLTVMLGFCGGNYTVTASAQMENRPMDVLCLLEENGVSFEFLKEPYRFPFRMHSKGISTDHLSADTDKSTQYASGILLAAAVQSRPFKLLLTGSRTHGTYIELTLDLLNDFGVRYERKENEISIFPEQCPPKQYVIEPDISGACYFYALSLLFGNRVLVERVNENSGQGDMRFLELLKEKGVRFTQKPEGLLADGSGISGYSGFDVNMREFSDQALTVAALAAFAETPTRIYGVGHIRFQECDRISAICTNLNALGVHAETDGENITVIPAPVQNGTVKTYEDHRVAMAFTLIGLKTGGIVIENPSCCRKTFENYFDIISELTN